MHKTGSQVYIDGSNIESDEEVQKMIEEWDRVKCKYCKKEISMLEARLIVLEDGSDAFICKTH